MAWTKINTYMTSIVLFIIFFTSMAIVGTDLINKDRITLSEDSIDYIGQLKGISIDSKADSFAKKNIGNSSQEGVIDSGENASVNEGSDFLATFNIKKERAAQPIEFMQMVYNMPRSLIITLGLPTDQFAHVINIFGWALFISLIMIAFRKLIGI